MEKRKLYKSGFFVALVSFLSKGLGYLREVILAYYFGTGAVVDGFRIAITAVLLPVNILSGSGLQNSFIPVFRSMQSTRKKRVAWVLANQLFFLLIFLGLVLFVLEFFFAENWVRILAPGFNEVQRDHAVFFTRIMSFTVPVILACSIGFVLNCFYIFKVPSLRPVIQNIFVLAGVLLTVYRGNFIFMGAAFPIAYLVFFVMLVFSLKKYWQFRFTTSLRRSRAVWAAFFPAWLPLLGMVLVAQLNVYVDRVITSLLSEGSVSALEYSRFIVETPGMTVGLGFMSVFLPYFSDLFAKKENEKLGRDIESMITFSVYIMLPISLVLFICPEDLIRLIFGYGKFGSGSVELTASALKGYSIGIWAYFLYIPISKYYQAVRRNVTLLISFSISLVLNTALNLLFYRPFGIAGIAVATSISQIVLFLILFGSMGLVSKRKIIGRMLYMLAAAVVTGAVLIYIRPYFESLAGRLAIVLAVTGVLWFGINMGIGEIREKFYELLRRGRGGDRTNRRDR